MGFINQLVLKLNSANSNKTGSFFINRNFLVLKILNFLYNQGIILGYVESKKIIVIFLNNKGISNSFSKIRFLKKRGLRLYFRYKDKKFLNYLKKDLVLITTSKGLITIEEALKLKIGGEFLLLVIF